MADRSLDAAYATLGLAPGATEDEIKRAWRKVARATHPDLNPGDPDAVRRFKEAEAAHALLTDPARRAGAERADRARAYGPDEDWIDACAWMAEAHFIRLRREALPRYAAGSRGGPSLVAALSAASRSGLADAAPDVRPSAWARLWAWYLWRRVSIVVDEGYPFGGGPVGLTERDGRLRIVLWPHVLWAEGVRDDDAVRRVVQRGVDLGVAAAALSMLDIHSVEPNPPPGADLRWWVQRLFWPVVVMLVVAFSVFVMGYAWVETSDPSRWLRRE